MPPQGRVSPSLDTDSDQDSSKASQRDISQALDSTAGSTDSDHDYSNASEPDDISDSTTPTTSAIEPKVSIRSDTDRTSKHSLSFLPKRRGRGPNKEKPIPSQKIELSVLTARKFGGDASVSSNINSALRRNYREAWETFDDYDDFSKNDIWETFLKRYTFPSGTNMRAVRSIFENVCQQRHSDWMNQLRERVTAVRGPDMNNWFGWDGRRPNGAGILQMKGHVWDALVRHWMDPNWQKKSKQNSKNRRSGEDWRVHHCTGSVPMATVAERMTKEMGRPIFDDELFIRTHSKKGKWVDKKSEKSHGTYLRNMREKLHASQNPDEPLDENSPVELPAELDVAEWDRACGGRKKSRTYGFGSLLDHAGSCGAAEPSSSSTTITSTRFIRRGSSSRRAIRSQLERTSTQTEDFTDDKQKIVELEKQRQELIQTQQNLQQQLQQFQEEQQQYREQQRQVQEQQNQRIQEAITEALERQQQAMQLAMQQQQTQLFGQLLRHLNIPSNPLSESPQQRTKPGRNVSKKRDGSNEDKHQ